MLQFDEFGYLTPDVNIQSTRDELEQIFKIDDHRAELFEKYLTYTENLKSAIGNKSFKQWIDGSFVTKKTHPNDLDLLSFIEYVEFENNASSLQDFIYPKSQAKYSVDAYIIVVYPEFHRKKFYFDSDYRYWLSNWSKDFASNRKKGFLEIIV